MAPPMSRTTGLAATSVANVLPNSMTVLMRPKTWLVNCTTLTIANALPSPTIHRLMVSPCSVTHENAFPAYSTALPKPSVNFWAIRSMVPSCCHCWNRSASSETLPLSRSSALPALMLPSVLMPTMVARALLATPVTVDHRPRMVVACFSMPPEKRSSIRAIMASLNFS